MTDLDKLLLSGAISAAVALLVTWLRGRNAVTQEQLKSDLMHEQERTKGTIRAEIEEGLQQTKAEADQKLEALRHDLKREALVHEVKFRKLYDRVATVIDEIFSKLTTTYKYGMTLVAELEPAGDESKEEKYRRFANAFNDLHSYILHNRIYLPGRIHRVINPFMDKLKETAIVFRRGFQQQARNLPVNGDYWGRANDAFTNTIMPLYERLCGELQAFIGLEEENPTHT